MSRDYNYKPHVPEIPGGTEGVRHTFDKVFVYVSDGTLNPHPLSIDDGTILDLNWS